MSGAFYSKCKVSSASQIFSISAQTFTVCKTLSGSHYHSLRCAILQFCSCLFSGNTSKGSSSRICHCFYRAGLRNSEFSSQQNDKFPRFFPQSKSVFNSLWPLLNKYCLFCIIAGRKLAVTNKLILEISELWD